MFAQMKGFMPPCKGRKQEINENVTGAIKNFLLNCGKIYTWSLIFPWLLILHGLVNPWSPGVERNIGYLCTIYVPPELKGLRKPTHNQ